MQTQSRHKTLHINRDGRRRVRWSSKRTQGTHDKTAQCGGILKTPEGTQAGVTYMAKGWLYSNVPASTDIAVRTDFSQHLHEQTAPAAPAAAADDRDHSNCHGGVRRSVAALRRPVYGR